MNAPTTKAYWDKGYEGTLLDAELSIDCVRNRPEYLIAQAIEKLNLAGKCVLAIGSGDPRWLT
jgi:hypothetical protein